MKNRSEDAVGRVAQRRRWAVAFAAIAGWLAVFVATLVVVGRWAGLPGDAVPGVAPAATQLPEPDSAGDVIVDENASPLYRAAVPSETGGGGDVSSADAPGPGDLEEYPVTEIPGLLAKGPQSVVESLPLDNSVLRFRKEPWFQELVAECVTDARSQYLELRTSYFDQATAIARKIAQSSHGRSPPPADYADEYSYSVVDGQMVYYTQADYPELFAVKRAIRRVPSRLAKEIQRRLEDAARSR